MSITEMIINAPPDGSIMFPLLKKNIILENHVTFRRIMVIIKVKAHRREEQKMDDDEIIDLYLARDENAISETSRKYGSALLKIAYRILGDFSSAQECENDTYLKVWNLIPPHEPRGYFFAFTARIVRFHAINECRKKSREKRSAIVCELSDEMLECLPSKSNTEAEMHAADLKKIINRYLESCPGPQQIVFVRRYWYCDTIAEIAESCGFTESRVKTMLYRMRKDLKKHLEKEGITYE